jgi:hypothetical protein
VGHPHFFPHFGAGCFGGKLVEMKLTRGFSAALGKNQPLRRLAVRDAIALGVLVAMTLALFGVTELYYAAYSRYRASLGLPTDNSPVITLPMVRRH